MPWRSSIDSDKFAAMMDILSGNGCAHDLDNVGHPGGCFCGGISGANVRVAAGNSPSERATEH